MKKFIAVLLAVLMICSVMTAAFSVFAEEGATDVTVVEDETQAEETQTEMPQWLTNLINRLMQVLTKLLVKFGIKIAIRDAIGF